MVRRDDFLLKVAYVIYFGPNPKKKSNHTYCRELSDTMIQMSTQLKNLVKRRFCRSFKLENVRVVYSTIYLSLIFEATIEKK